MHIIEWWREFEMACMQVAPSLCFVHLSGMWVIVNKPDSVLQDTSTSFLNEPEHYESAIASR